MMIPEIYYSTLAALVGPKDAKTLSDKDKTLKLYHTGQINIPLPSPRGAVVGSRNSSLQGDQAATQIAKYLASKGILVCSGLAKGIDSAAHLGAIKAHGGVTEAHGTTLAVLGTPIDQPNPQKRWLKELIGQRHMLVSQFPSGSPVYPNNFLQRNQTLAQLTHASIIIEAQQRSGSLNHARHALKLGHPLYIYRPLNQNQPWTKPLITAGAVFFTDPKDITEKLPPQHKGGINSLDETELFNWQISRQRT